MRDWILAGIKSVFLFAVFLCDWALGEQYIVTYDSRVAGPPSLGGGSAEIVDVGRMDTQSRKDWGHLRLRSFPAPSLVSVDAMDGVPWAGSFSASLDALAAQRSKSVAAEEAKSRQDLDRAMVAVRRQFGGSVTNVAALIAVTSNAVDMIFREMSASRLKIDSR